MFPATRGLRLAARRGLVLPPPSSARALIEARTLHVLEQARLGDLPAELLQDEVQTICLAQRDDHANPIPGRVNPETNKDLRRQPQVLVISLWCSAAAPCRGSFARSGSSPQGPEKSRAPCSGPKPLLPFVQGPWPVRLKEAGERPVGQEFSAGLAARAVVHFVLGVADALHGRCTDWTGESIAPVHRHSWTKRRDLLRKPVTGLLPQPSCPGPQRFAHGSEQEGDLRSEERRVGKECRSRMPRDQYKKKEYV